MLHRWADRSRIRRPVSIPLLVLVTATGTAFAGTTAAETAPLNKPVVAVATAP